MISPAVLLDHRFSLSFCDAENLLAQKRVVVSCQRVRCRCLKFGSGYRRAAKRCEGQLADAWYVDEVSFDIGGEQFGRQ
jgi:putative transposase